MSFDNGYPISLPLVFFSMESDAGEVTFRWAAKDGTTLMDRRCNCCSKAILRRRRPNDFLSVAVTLLLQVRLRFIDPEHVGDSMVFYKETEQMLKYIKRIITAVFGAREISTSFVPAPALFCCCVTFAPFAAASENDMVILPNAEGSSSVGSLKNPPKISQRLPNQ